MVVLLNLQELHTEVSKYDLTKKLCVLGGGHCLEIELCLAINVSVSANRNSPPLISIMQNLTLVHS